MHFVAVFLPKETILQKASLIFPDLSCYVTSDGLLADVPGWP